jgi:hypothetical protein
VQGVAVFGLVLGVLGLSLLDVPESVILEWMGKLLGSQLLALAVHVAGIPVAIWGGWKAFPII